VKIAIPTFATRVSPRFDCAQSLLLVTIDEGGVSSREELEVTGWAPHQRINLLAELGVGTVICGGIDRWSTALLQSAGITVYGWVTGEAEDALAALLQGDLDSEALAGKTGRCACRRFPGNDGAGTGPPLANQAIGRRGGCGRKHAGGRRPGPAGA